MNDTSTLSSNNLDKSIKQDVSIQTNISHEFDDPFHRTLYNELAPESDLNELLEQSLQHAEVIYLQKFYP